MLKRRRACGDPSIRPSHQGVSSTRDERGRRTRSTTIAAWLQKKSHILFLLCIILSSDAQSTPRNKHVIGSRTSAGFGCLLLAALTHWIWCAKNNHEPVMFWNGKCLFYDKTRGKNAWEYYFMPVGCEFPENGDHINDWQCAPDYTFWPAPRCLSRRQRREAYEFFQNHLFLRPELTEEIELFCKKNFAGKIVIGLHLRGTDKATECNMPSPFFMIELACKTAQIIEKVTGVHPRVFVATDEELLLAYAREILGTSRTIAAPAYRSVDGAPVHLVRNCCSPADLGKDAVIDMYLLSRCSLLIHSLSNLPEVSSCLSPEMPIVFVPAPVDIHEDGACPFVASEDEPLLRDMPPSERAAAEILKREWAQDPTHAMRKKHAPTFESPEQRASVIALTHKAVAGQRKLNKLKPVCRAMELPAHIREFLVPLAQNGEHVVAYIR